MSPSPVPFEVAMVGLGVMGANLLRNLESKGYSGLGFDLNAAARERFRAGISPGTRLGVVDDWSALAAGLKSPRRVFVMVPAGAPVDAVLEQLESVLAPGDLVVDCGNSHYSDSQRREARLSQRGLRFMGLGVSGGEAGALFGPSLMPGASPDAWEALKPLLTAIAARTEDGPCVAHLGPAGAGHYVKMVHNGIEYGDMQLLAEAYHLLGRLGGFSNADMASIFEEWNGGELESFLVEITVRVLNQPDPETGGALIDQIEDSAGMKGTGTWTVQEALTRGVPIPTIAAAVDARMISAHRPERLRAAGVLPGPDSAPSENSALNSQEKAALVSQVRDALFCAKACGYAQGFALLSAAAREFSWPLPLAEIARLWQGGCIIRSRFLRDLRRALLELPASSSLLLHPWFVAQLNTRQKGWRQVLALGHAAGLALPALSASLAYYDALRTRRLPTNLIQAQRDLFGAHTYRRLDREGVFHTEWGD
ncbi:MAG: NADP-dependent phosphogluconate dehydrogenase [Deltaproteobacteria bacterium]|nr:NADP-dependent phosphogluconate dehydrogenase [Deltaproteobacteria bacterium]